MILYDLRLLLTSQKKLAVQEKKMHPNSHPTDTYFTGS